MNLSARTVGNVAIVDLAGRIVSSGGAPALPVELKRLLDAGYKHILINLSDVPYMDSAGLGDLLAAKKKAMLAGAELKMLRPSRRVYSLIAETGLNRVFECFTDEQTAIRSFAAGGRAPLV